MKRAIDITLLWFSQEALTKDQKQILIGTIVSAEQTKDRGRSAMHCSTTGLQQDYDATRILCDVGSVYERLSKLTSISHSFVAGIQIWADFVFAKIIAIIII